MITDEDRDLSICRATLQHVVNFFDHYEPGDDVLTPPLRAECTRMPDHGELIGKKQPFDQARVRTPLLFPQPPDIHRSAQACTLMALFERIFSSHNAPSAKRVGIVHTALMRPANRT